jgi:hypothetical protein
VPTSDEFLRVAFCAVLIFIALLLVFAEDGQHRPAPIIAAGATVTR